jgi:hypothetical protein
MPFAKLTTVLLFHLTGRQGPAVFETLHLAGRQAGRVLGAVATTLGEAFHERKKGEKTMAALLASTPPEAAQQSA